VHILYDAKLAYVIFDHLPNQYNILYHQSANYIFKSQSCPLNHISLYHLSLHPPSLRNSAILSVCTSVAYNVRFSHTVLSKSRLAVIGSLEALICRPVLFLLTGFGFSPHGGDILYRSEIFITKEWPDPEIWVWGRSRSLKMARFDRPCRPMTFY